MRKLRIVHRLHAHLNGLMFCAAVLMAVVASLIAGLLPAWQACRVPPALQLKSE